MPIPSRPHGQVASALDDINARIRRLMGQPASKDRTQRYHKLLAEWGDLVRGDVEPAA
ncbi:hypothetical protein GCM10018980_71160 [Streptomyces capoamus]|uniref:Uncharacterized protein n=1 Tax=Streptomyces capoamus TaxID=68183 RepID=A0A919F3U2_9ACTN|nr:hypothetical protein [Streptomyces capoamus]GGW13253.1 hypothetical protein GCM10010501_16070 [Streptomyces libani subsp. rufus]GHG74337.1 hypothetical protein GCM10018980_71160 [Streptomyces capoamus]